MVNKNSKLNAYLFALTLVAISLLTAYLTWSLLKIPPVVHHNSEKKKYEIKEVELKAIKNPQFINIEIDEDTGRTDPFTSY